MSICPVCKGDCSEYVFDCNGDIVGCERCTWTRDSGEYDAEQAELFADYNREMFMSDR